jgi:hypothetical protein
VAGHLDDFDVACGHGCPSAIFVSFLILRRTMVYEMVETAEGSCTRRSTNVKRPCAKWWL